MENWQDIAKVITPAALVGLAIAIGKGAKGVWTVSSSVTKITEGMDHQAELLQNLAASYEKKVESDRRRFDQIEERVRTLEQRD